MKKNVMEQKPDKNKGKKEGFIKINNNDISTTKEDESFITDEVIQYCSSPNTGLVSINRARSINSKFTPNPSEKNNITNTITMSIAMLKKEIDSIEKERLSIRSSMFYKNENDNNDIANLYDKCNEKNKNSKFIFREREKEFNHSGNVKHYSNTPKNILNRGKFNNFVMNYNKKSIKKRISKIKKLKKSRKNQEKFEGNNKEKDRRLSFENENNKKKKKKKKKTKQNSNAKKLKEYENEEDKGGQSPNIIIFDCSSLEKNEDSEESCKKNNDDSEDSYKENKSVIETENKKIKVGRRNSLTEDRKNFYKEKAFITPKFKQSCYVNSSLKFSQTKILRKSSKRKMTTHIMMDSNKTNYIVKSKANLNNKEKEKKHNFNNILNIFTTKNLYNNNDNPDNKPVKVRHSISKHFSKINHSQEKMKSKIKHKDSVHSCKHLYNKKYKQIIHKYENEKFEKYCKKKEEKDQEFKNKSNKNISRKTLNKITHTGVKSLNKNIYNSNRNLTKITINPKTVENKDIHLVFDGKKETIINYTNQEMVDDENEYMVECLKVLLNLKKEEQPRCKQKVNFNFPENEKNKKIALFDLDETLVHCTKDQKGLNGDIVNIKLPTNKTVQVGLNIRSHWKEALDLIKNQYHIVVYTASHQSYADAVLNYLDKEKKYFQYRLYRNHCVQCDVDGVKFYVKDLDTLDKYYNLKDVVLIDNSVLSFAYHLNNGIPIVPFIEQRDDTQLLMLAYYLLSIASFDDLTQENKKHINIEHFLLLAKKLADEEYEEEQKIANNNAYDNESKNKENNNDLNNLNKDNTIKEETEEEKSSCSKTISIFNKRLYTKTSEKALKIAQDMNKNIYRKNYK